MAVSPSGTSDGVQGFSSQDFKTVSLQAGEELIDDQINKGLEIAAVVLLHEHAGGVVLQGPLRRLLLGKKTDPNLPVPSLAGVRIPPRESGVAEGQICCHPR